MADKNYVSRLKKIRDAQEQRRNSIENRVGKDLLINEPEIRIIRAFLNLNKL